MADVETQFSKDLKSAHGIIMVLTWGILTTLGVMTARYGKLLRLKEWRQKHQALQAVSAMLTFPITFLSYVAVREDDKHSHYSTIHGKLGIAISVLSFFQGISGSLLIGRFGFRCLSVPSCVVLSERRFFQVVAVHVSAGYLVFVAALSSIFLGLWLYFKNPFSPEAYIYFGVMGVIVMTFGILEFKTWGTRKRAATLVKTEAERLLLQTDDSV